MFEKIVRYVLNCRSMKEPIFKKLDLRNENFELTQYWDKQQQIDLIVNHLDDRISRASEIKWMNDARINLKNIFSDLEEKEYPVPKNFHRKNYLAIFMVGKTKNTNHRIPVICVSDLF